MPFHLTNNIQWVLIGMLKKTPKSLYQINQWVISAVEIKGNALSSLSLSLGNIPCSTITMKKCLITSKNSCLPAKPTQTCILRNKSQALILSWKDLNPLWWVPTMTWILSKLTWSISMRTNFRAIGLKAAGTYLTLMLTKWKITSQKRANLLFHLVKALSLLTLLTLKV